MKRPWDPWKGDLKFFGLLALTLLGIYWGMAYLLGWRPWEADAMRRENPLATPYQGAEIGSAVIATVEPAQIGEIFVIGSCRHRVLKEITKQEFLDQLAANEELDSGVCGVADMAGSSAVGFRSESVPSFSAKHYYRVTVEPSRGADAEL